MPKSDKQTESVACYFHIVVDLGTMFVRNIGDDSDFDVYCAK